MSPVYVVRRGRLSIAGLLFVSCFALCGSSCGGNPTDAESMDPQFTGVAVRVNNHRYGEANGCTSTFTPQVTGEAVSMANTITCGHPGAVSMVRWKYLRTDKAGDHYNFARTFPSDAPVNTTTYKDVVYAGEALVVFEDDVQRIVLMPPPESE